MPPASPSRYSLSSGSWRGVAEACSAWLSSMGGRWQFRKVALTTQAMVADTFFFPHRGPVPYDVVVFFRSPWIPSVTC